MAEVTQLAGSRIHQGNQRARAVAARGRRSRASSACRRGGNADGDADGWRRRGGAAAPAEEKTDFTVSLLEIGANKINVIKVVREDDQPWSEGSQGSRRERAQADQGRRPKDEAAAIKKKFEDVGAKVEIK
jgi:hypothetical protein